MRLEQRGRTVARSRNFRSIAEVAGPYAALLIFTLLFYRSVLFTTDTFIPFDLPFYHLPQAVVASHSLHGGYFPLWDSSVFCGRPLFAEIQAQVFYPFRLLTVLLADSSSHVSLLRALEGELIFHVFLAGVFTLWLARSIGLNGPSALLSASAYSLGCYFASQAEHIGAMETAAWLPLAWLMVIRLTEKVTIGRFALFAGTVALIVLAGYTPGAIVIVMSVGILALVVLWRKPKPVVIVSAGLAVGFLLAAIQIIPTLQLSTWSIGHLRAGWRGTGGGLHLPVLMSIVWPNYLGVFSWSTLRPTYEITFSYLYCGMVVVLMALLGLFFKPARIKYLVCTLLGISGVWMVGDSTPVGKALFLILPHSLQGPFYVEIWMAVFSLSVALLAGFGLRLLNLRPHWAYLVVFLAAADLIVMGSDRPMNTTRYDPGSIAVDSAIDGERTALAAMRNAERAAFPPYRVDVYKGDQVWAADATLTGIPSANGMDPLAVERLLRVRQAAGGLMWAWSPVTKIAPGILSMMSVKYLIAGQPVPAVDLRESGFSLAQTFPGRYLYENANVLPRFSWGRHITISSGEEQSVSLIDRPDWNPAQDTVVEGYADSGGSLSDGVARVLKYEDNEIVLQTRTSGEGFLVSSESYYPGWRAAVDGKETPIYITNVAFRGIQIPPGDHQVTFRFRPTVLWYSSGVSLLTMVMLCGAGFFSGSRGGAPVLGRVRWHISLWLFRAARAIRP